MVESDFHAKLRLRLDADRFGPASAYPSDLLIRRERSPPPVSAILSRATPDCAVSRIVCSLGQIQGNLAVIGAGIILQKSAPRHFRISLLVGRNLTAVGPLVDFPVVHPGALSALYANPRRKRHASVDLYLISRSNSPFSAAQ